MYFVENILVSLNLTSYSTNIFFLTLSTITYQILSLYYLEVRRVKKNNVLHPPNCEKLKTAIHPDSTM